MEGSNSSNNLRIQLGEWVTIPFVYFNVMLLYDNINI